MNGFFFQSLLFLFHLSSIEQGMAAVLYKLSAIKSVSKERLLKSFIIACTKLNKAWDRKTDFWDILFR